MKQITYYIGVDGGGTGTRVKILDSQLKLIAQGHGASSALSQGVPQAWLAIQNTIAQAFGESSLPPPSLKECSIGLGLSGVNNKQWKEEFSKTNPGYKNIVIESDGITTLLGAHHGSAGIIIALGTGSIGMVKHTSGEIHSVSGWGYPSGDEASGSWLGIQALRYTEKVMDGRKASSPLSQLIKKKCGESPQALLHWLGDAKQKEYATLAPLVFEAATSHDDSFAKQLINDALIDIEEMIVTLDQTQKLSFALCGKLGEAFIPFLPQKLATRYKAPKGNSIDGAIMLATGKYQ